MTQKPTITTVEQLRELDPAPCEEALEWLAENNITDLADAWDRCHRADWMLWLCNALDLLSDREWRMIACKCIRETPLADGRKVWDLLADDRSRHAVAVAERYADGEATDEELAAAYAAARSAVDAAYASYYTTAVTAARTARADAAYAAYAAAAAAAKVARADATAAVRAAAAAAVHTATAAAAYAEAAADAADAAQADIVRAIAGNPFR
jgi:hypothetical protein